MDMSRFMKPPPDAPDDPQAYQMAMDDIHPSVAEPLAPNTDSNEQLPDDALKAAILEQAEKLNQFSERFQDTTAQQNEQRQQQALQMLKGNINEQSH